MAIRNLKYQSIPSERLSVPLQLMEYLGPDGQDMLKGFRPTKGIKNLKYQPNTEKKN